MVSSPYVVGQWVRGPKFYGRTSLIQEIIEGPRSWLWLLGTRRIGKTSLLKQIEWLASKAPEKNYFPVFWDFQGADTVDELNLSLGDALLDIEDRLDEIGVSPDEIESDDVFSGLRRLRRKVRAKNMKLLLLCDEVEELIKLNEQDPSLLRKLRRVMQSGEDIRSVLASTIRLWQLSDERGDTSPFLHGFLPPLYIHNLSNDEARSLICQLNLESTSRPPLDEACVEKIRAHCDNHPYLLQLVCKRYLELRDLDEAIEQVATDPMVSFFFSVDFEMLSDTERRILRLVAEHSMSTSRTIQERVTVDTDHLRGLLHRLEHLGFIRRNEERKFVLINYFFRRWYRAQPLGSKSSPPDALDGHAGGTATTAADHASALPTVTMDPDRQRPDQLGLFDGRYELKELVGQGATGKVYRAQDLTLRVDIAIKVLRPQFVANDEAFDRFRQEIVLAREISHPNVLRIYHLGEFGDKKYLTMQWVEGPDLAELIKRQAPLPFERTIAITLKLLSALEVLHRRRILHRDIKPHNILLDDRSGEPILTDFGLARLLGEPGMTSTGIFLGTPQYASPEQAKLLPLDERSDLYSLGLVMFEMATGARPFVGEGRRSVLDMHRTEPPPAPIKIDRSVPINFSNVILRCLEKEPSRRYDSAAELRVAVEACRV